MFSKVKTFLDLKNADCSSEIPNKIKIYQENREKNGKTNRGRAMQIKFRDPLQYNKGFVHAIRQSLIK